MNFIIISAGLIGENGDGWYNMRMAVQQDMLRPKTAHAYIESLTKISDLFLEMLEGKLETNRRVPDNTVELLYTWSMDSICRIFLDRPMIYCPKEEQIPEAQEFLKDVDAVIKSGTNFFWKPPIWKVLPNYTPWLRKINKNFDGIYFTIRKYTEEAIRDIESGKRDTSPDSKSVIKKFLENEKVNLDMIHTMALDGIVAGIDTTAITVGFLLYNLSTYPEVQEKLFQEIVSVCGKDKLPTAEEIGRMKYLRACMRESHRFTPTIVGTTRKLENDINLEGYNIPAGTSIMLSFNTTNFSKDYFENPNVYNPDRFMRGQGNTVESFSSVPFGHGSRSCIGRRFAELEIALLVIRTLQKYKLEYPEDQDKTMPILCEFVNKPGKPYGFQMKLRS